MQNAIAAGGRDRERDKHKQRLQAKDVSASNGRVYQVYMYLLYSSTFNTHKLIKTQAILLWNNISFMVLITN